MPYLNLVLVQEEVIHSSLRPRREEDQGATTLETSSCLMWMLTWRLMIQLGQANAPERRSRRPRFPPCQAGSEAYTGEIDDNIEDTYLQHDLKRHPSA